MVQRKGRTEIITEAFSTDPIIGHGDFIDSTRRAVYRDEQGQYVEGEDGEPVYGWWLRPTGPGSGNRDGARWEEIPSIASPADLASENAFTRQNLAVPGSQRALACGNGCSAVDGPPRSTRMSHTTRTPPMGSVLV
jgi:hypothetical protein